MTNLIISLFLVLFLSCGHHGHPTAMELKSRLLQNKSDFDSLAAMLNNDSSIRRLSSNTIFYANDDEITDERLLRYREKLARLGIDNGIHRDSAKSIRFIVTSRGFPSTTHSKGYLYADETPEPLVDSIDDFVSSRKQFPVYQHIESNWYLVYESW